MSEIINASLKRNFPEDNVNIIAEPGRYFVYSAGTLICKIHAKREVHLPNGQLLSKQYYVNDGVYTSFNSVITLDIYVTVQYFVVSMVSFSSSDWNL